MHTNQCREHMHGSKGGDFQNDIEFRQQKVSAASYPLPEIKRDVKF